MKPISSATLRALAGDQAYELGKRFHSEETVSGVLVEGNQITADVIERADIEGGVIWRVSLHHTAQAFEGSCDCPVSEHFEFCEHCVAASLSYMAMLDKQKKLQDLSGKTKLRAYLDMQDKEALVSEMLLLIQREQPVLDEWMLSSELASGSPQLTGLKKRIRQAIPIGKHLDRRSEISSFYQRVDLMLRKLNDLLPSVFSEDALTLVDYAIERLGGAQKTIEDHAQLGENTIELLLSQHLASCLRLQWPAGKLADYLFERYVGEYDSLYQGLPDNYSELLGEDGMRCFLDQLKQYWDALPALTIKADWAQSTHYAHIARPLLVDAISYQNVDLRIELLAKTAVAFSERLALSVFALQNNRIATAIQWFNRAAKLQKTGDSQSLLNQKVDILCYQGKMKAAEELLWSHYKAKPRIEIYQQLQQVASTDDNSRAASASDRSYWYTKAESEVLARTNDEKQYYRSYYIEQLVKLYCLEGDEAKAQALADETDAIEVD